MVTFRPMDSDYFVNKHSRIVGTVQRDYHPLVHVNVGGDYHPSSMALLGDYDPYGRPTRGLSPLGHSISSSGSYIYPAR